MDTKNIIKAFNSLRNRLQSSSDEDLILAVSRAKAENSWFTEESIKMSLKGISLFLNEETLSKWTSVYPKIKASKTIALVMAGNIPLVGFHDFLAVIISGHKAQIKVSSKDSVLIKQLAKMLTEAEPALAERISFVERLKDFDAVIATGSDNSARYFDYYFGKYPNIIRKNRASCAILQGNETDEQLFRLGDDVFSYFGLGCRNVSKLFVPETYEFNHLLRTWEKYTDVGNHHKYHNNYDYQKSIMLVNSVPFLDNGIVMITESERLVSPISVVYYERYKSLADLGNTLSSISNKLQCVVGEVQPATIPFGETQYPPVTEYADQVDTMAFLSNL